MSARVSNAEMQRTLYLAKLKKLMERTDFQDFLLHFFKTAGILRTTHRANPVHSAFAEGRRALGNEVLIDLLAADAGGVRMVFPTDAIMLRAFGPPQQPTQDESPEDDDPRDSEPFER